MTGRNDRAIIGKVQRKEVAAEGAGHARPAGPVGLRDRKKAQQRLDLIDIAVKLFKKHGYETVRMEDIAARANVSTKTVYNYFPTKRDILIEFLVSDRERSTGLFNEIISMPRGEPIADLLRLMEADIGDVVSPGERSLWLEIMAVTVRERGDERFRRYRLMFTSYIEALLAELQAGGKLSRSLDLSLAANLIHVLHSENFDNFCTIKDLTVSDALSMAGDQLALLLSGWITNTPAGKAPRGRKPKSR
jgi:AcrR family transcriptional regulator